MARARSRVEGSSAPDPAGPDPEDPLVRLQDGRSKIAYEFKRFTRMDEAGQRAFLKGRMTELCFLLSARAVGLARSGSRWGEVVQACTALGIALDKRLGESWEVPSAEGVSVPEAVREAIVRAFQPREGGEGDEASRAGGAAG